MTFTERIKNFCLQQNLLSDGDRVLVGVSGGGDSIALLCTLFALRHFFGLQLYVAHLNHGLRLQAYKEQLYVKSLCSRFGIPFFTKTISLKKITASLEEAAREARLKFFIKTAKKLKIKTIALGHHQNDLAETVLMRILRGAGPMGARGILPRRTIDGVTIIRPFLNTNRKEIKKFLIAKKIKFFIDASNNNKKFLRNKIRLDLLPQLQNKYNPNIIEVLTRFSENLTVCCDYLRRQSERSFISISQKKHGKKAIYLDARKASGLHPAILHETIRLTIEKLLGHTRRLTFAHIKKIEILICAKANSSSIDLPFGLRINRIKNCIIFLKQPKYSP